LASDERWHLAASYKRFRWTATARWNGASFYDLFGPTKVSRKGGAASLQYTRSIVHDTPREMEWTAGLAGYTGLERLPEFQNVETSPGFDKLVAANASLSYKNQRASLGAIDYEKGVKWRLGAYTNFVRQGFAGDAAWKAFPLALATLDLGTPMPIRNASLWLRTAAGVSPGDRDEPFANFYFGGFGNNSVDHQDPKRYRDPESFPGREIDDIGGRNFTKALVECNLPALRFRRVGTPAFYATWARLSLFAAGLATNVDDEPSRRTVADVGAQVDVRFQLFTLEPLTASVGYARAFEKHRLPTQEWMASLKLL
jgi:hypothetical protein